MYRVTRGNVDININLPNGIYRFNSESGTGKTYLYHLLNILYDAGCPVIGLTYRDIVAMFPVFPTGSIISNVVHHDWASAVTEHRKYVDRYNKISQRMHKQDSILDYRDIGYMI